MKEIVDNQESIAKQNKSEINWALLFWVIFGVISLVVIVVLVYGQIEERIVRNNQRVELQFRIEEKRQQLHIEELRWLQTKADVLDRLTKLQRSARTEKERAFVRSEEAKLRALDAEHARVLEAAKADLAAAN
jgi:hypothetical protein